MGRLKAVFLDRDGVLNEYLPGAYVENPGKLRLTAGAARAVRKLNDAGVPAIVISNQQGVGKGLMTHADLLEVEAALKAGVRDAAGGTITRFYYCTHLGSDDCACRKPKPGMVLDALRHAGIDAADTAFIGDSAGDMAAASAAGVAARVLALGGATKAYRAGVMDVEPDVVCADVEAAVDYLLENYK